MSDIEDVAAELAAKIEAELQVPVYVGSDIAVKKFSHFALVTEEQLAEGDHMAALLAAALDPNRTPEPPWTGEPLTPKPAAYLSLVELTRRPLREVIELHGPKPHSVHSDGTVSWWECGGCEFSGYDGEPPDWPCGTTAVIARYVGVELGP